MIATVRNLARDPRVMGVLRAGPRVGLFLARGNRRTASVGPDDSIVPVRPTPSLALQAYLDEVLIALFRHPDLLPRPADYAPAAADVADIRELFSTCGWLEQPAQYHRKPPMPDDIRAWHGRAAGLGYEHVTFTSGWEPDPEEPGRNRWLSHEANRTVHAVGVAYPRSRAPVVAHLCPWVWHGHERVDGLTGISNPAAAPPGHQRRRAGPSAPRAAGFGPDPRRGSHDH